MHKPHHRKDINALRALAVLAVIGFHFFPNYFHFGFLGVDLFFVISGYLITKILRAQLLEKKFSYLLFYTKRIRRIFPAMLVMLIATTITAICLLIAPDLLRYSKSQLATLGFMANIYFWRTGGYFSTADELKPLLHMWSLGVEEQFYILFPLALALIVRTFRKPIGSSLVILFISAISYSANIYINSIGGANPAFFLLPTRIWQFGVGSIFALLPSLSCCKSEKQANILFIGGLVLIGVNFTLPPNILPSATLLSIGAGLILWNHLERNSTPVKLLAARPIQLIGLCSFSLYLWHWPILVFLKYVHIAPLPANILLIALLLTFAISYLSWKYIENPFRDVVSTKTTFKFICAIYLILVITSLATISSSGFPGRDSEHTNAISEAIDTNYRCPPSTYRIYGASRACLIGELGPTPTLALLGNSHAQMYAPSFDTELALRHQSGLIIPLNGCLPTIDINISIDCLRMANTNYEAVVSDSSLRQVVIGMTWYSDDLINQKGEAISDIEFSYRKKSLFLLIDKLTKAGKKVYLIGPLAIPNFDFASIASRSLKFSKNQIPFSISRETFDQKFNPLILYFSERLKKQFIAPHGFFCDEYQCNFADDKGAYFSDSNHISLYGAQKIRGLFKPIFEEVNR